MENYKVKGKIIQISEVKTFDNGAKSLTYRIDNGNQYSNVMQFELYKKQEYASHVDNFIKYNKVGDEVEIEFNIRTREWEGKIYTNLSSWKIDLIGSSDVKIKGLKDALDLEPTEDDDLPF